MEALNPFFVSHELALLSLLLLVAFILAPAMTNRFVLRGSRVYKDTHKVALFALVIGAMFNFRYLVWVWPAFCLFGCVLFFRRGTRGLSLTRLNGWIPLVFSVISSTWFVAGALDLKLLGYPPSWSFYASLHGAFLGWLIVGCVVFLSLQSNAHTFYRVAPLIILASFLCIAFGIDGVPFVKRIGVVGTALTVPTCLSLYALSVRQRQDSSKLFSMLALLSIGASMTLAILNEFWLDFPRTVAGYPTMVLTHGVLNGLLAGPCFFWALSTQQREQQQSSHSVVLFDDVCVLCNGSVAALLRADRKRRLKYASLRGEFAQREELRERAAKTDSIVYWHQGQVYDQAAAVIEILETLGGVYRVIARALGVFPLFFLDALYRVVARYRYRIFGKSEACFIPSPQDRALFLP